MPHPLGKILHRAAFNINHKQDRDASSKFRFHSRQGFYVPGYLTFHPATFLKGLVKPLFAPPSPMNKISSLVGTSDASCWMSLRSASLDSNLSVRVRLSTPTTCNGGSPSGVFLRTR